MKTAVVTGATGFIGRGSLQPLLERGFEVHAVSSRQTDPDTNPGVYWHQHDLLDAATAEALMAQLTPTHLLHLAWYATPGLFWQSPANLDWVGASLRLLRAFGAHGGQRAVLAGTCAEYAWDERTVCSETETPCNPATLYGTSKHALRLIAERYATQAGVSLAWGRVFFVFGPHEDPARLGGSVAAALVRGEKALCSDGRQLRDFLYSEDLADAFVALLDSSVEGAVNMASGQTTPIRGLVEALASAAGRPDLPQFGGRATPDGEPLELLADVARLRDEVGWSPPAGLERRAGDTIAWWRRELAESAARRSDVSTSAPPP